MSGDQLSTYRFQEEYIKELRGIDTEINDLNKTEITITLLNIMKQK